MLILALDTATAGVTVGLVRLTEGPQVLAERRLPGPARHGEQLSPAISAVLAAAGCRGKDLEAIVVGIGPGPFTGLRVGMVTAAAFGDALAVPVHGVCSLDAIACGLPYADGTTLVATDARRREVYWATYAESLIRLAGPQVQRPADLARQLPTLAVRRGVGAGTVLYADVLGLPAVDAYPGAAGLVTAALPGLTGGAAPAPLTPLYLRRPDATPATAPKRTLPATAPKRTLPA